MIKFFISNATAKDVLGICLVQKEGWVTTYVSKKYGITKKDILEKDFVSAKRLARWRKSIKDKKVKTVVAKIGAKVVGFCVGVKRKEYNELGAVYVLKKYRGQGIGQALMNMVFKWFGAEKNIVLNVVVFNKRTIAIYKKMDFKIVGKTSKEELAKLPSGKLMPEVKMIKKFK